MKLHIVRADPAGNITVFVTDPVEKKDYSAVSSALLRADELKAEQVGFLTNAMSGGMMRLEMMGGEFCGNALRSAGLYCAVKNGLTGKSAVKMEISGSADVLEVTADADRGTSTAEMPLPERIEEIEIPGGKAKAVVFEGIVHVILYGRTPDDETVGKTLEAVLEKYDAAAVGMMFIDGDGTHMHPVVYVGATDSLVHESSCASGTAAVMASFLSDRPDGAYELTVRQPGGSIEATGVKRGGVIEKLTIGGSVTLSREFEVEI